MRKLYTVFVLSVLTLKTFAQSGEIQGRVFDGQSKEGIPFGTVVLLQGGSQKGFGQTDDDGNYVIKPVGPGTYDVVVEYLGYAKAVYSGVKVEADRTTRQDIALSSSAKELINVTVVADPLIKPDNTTQQNTLDRKDIEQISTRGTVNYAGLGSNVFQKDDDDALNISGARTNATKYYVDGIPMRESINLPASAIEQLSVLTGGIPARYGDATGGIVNITTRGASETYGGGFEGVTSEFLDGFGYDLGSVNLSGPILVKNKGTDSSNAVLGFFLAGEFEHNKDADPSAIGMYKVKDDVLTDLEQNPLQPSALATGFVPRAAFITSDDLEQIKYKQNIADFNYRLSGKFDYELNKYITLTAGGQFDLTRNHAYDYLKQLFDPSYNQYVKNNTYRGFVRFTQRFPISYDDKGNANSVFQNAYYSIQADYTKFYQTFGDKDLWFDPFKYGYVGKFETSREPIYGFGTDSATGLSGFLLQGYQDTLVTFTPGDVNPNLTNYTMQYYDLAGDQKDIYYSNIFEIQSGGGLLNGQAPPNIYSLWRPTGYPVGSYGLRNRSQYRLSLNASVDIITKSKTEKTGQRRHSLEFGFEYEQRVDQGYTVSPFGLWGLARQLTNGHILQLDVTNPHPVYDATGTVFLDTINYDRLVQSDQQAYFDQQLRLALGLDPNGSDYIDVDALDPSVFSLSMFSPDELLNNGSNYYFAFGYDYLGNKLSTQPSFDDFFNQKDDNGNFTRNIAAFQPIYSAAYLQDKFNFKDLIFNVGLRVDRYDANQKVLKDPYSLYPIRTVAEVTDLGTIPSTMGSDFAVYVNDFENPTTIVGYRNGDTWYDATGTEVADPSVIAKGSVTGQITPYLESTDVNNLVLSSSSFEDYTPQFTVMPRIAFSFPISDEALFFAHYDVLSERPSGTDARGVSFGTPFDYYFLEQINTDVTIANPNLKPERTIDYQVGFKQALSQNFALTISGTYRELKDMVQVRKYSYAYPVDYTTYGNEDFGTVKSLAVTVEMRRTKNIKLDGNYTLQFADGTGSGATSQLNLIGAGQPNLKVLLPFSYDQRHTISTSVDYRFPEKDYNGPMLGKKPVLANTGLNVIFRAGSGTPFTRQTSATPDAEFGIVTGSTLSGNINGSRLPWTFKLDSKIDKDFKLSGDKPGQGLYLNIYLLVENVLNTKNVVSVYPYTGNPGDDGYIDSAIGQQTAVGQLNPTAYELLYGIKSNNPDNYTQPRRIHVGAIVNF